MTTKTYTVHRSMHGNGRDFEPGDTRELDDIDARDLVESGAISLEGEEPNARGPAVRHTFGSEQSALNDEGYTTADGGRAISTASVAAPVKKVSAPKP